MVEIHWQGRLFSFTDLDEARRVGRFSFPEDLTEDDLEKTRSILALAKLVEGA